MWKQILAVSLGAAVGACLRWALSEALNRRFPSLPMGTLSANLLGAYFAGLTVAWLCACPQLSPEWRLLLVTGFCGGLTTFSTFSLELTEHLQGGRLGPAAVLVATHLLGSLLLTWAGFLTVQGWRAS
ncbi:MAG: fluoride efflux transporter CrcB [Verrucomicrobiota bacterium]|jgi:CrcB protein